MPPPPTGLADEMLARTERLNRAGLAIQEICEREKVRLVVGSLNLTNDGRIDPQIHLIALA